MQKRVIDKRGWEYGIIPNELLNNTKVSLKAKGMYAFLQSKHNLNLSGLKEGSGSIRTALQELEKNGYLERKQVKDKQGKWNGYEYYLLK